MRYALISDIHGNLPALEAVLADIEHQAVDHILVLGDYVGDLPWPNEEVERLRSLPNATVIAGNHEGYMVDLHRQDASTWIYEQFAPLYWNYRTLTQENLAYLMALPQRVELPMPDGTVLSMEHVLPIHRMQPKVLPMHSSQYGKGRPTPYTHQDHLTHGREAVLAHGEAAAWIARQPRGVQTFGHSHLQWHMEHQGYWLVNPGSCGLPTDHRPGAPYTILTYTGQGWTVEERRAVYDIDGTVAALKASTLFEQAEIWCRVIIQELRTGVEQIGDFLAHAVAVAGTPMPVSNQAWRRAADTFEKLDVWKVV